MSDEDGVELLALRCDVVTDLDGTALRDALEYFDPDLVYVVRELSDVRVVSRLRRAFDGPVVSAGGPADVRTETVAGITFVFADSASLLEDRAGDETSIAEYVVCDDIEPMTDAVMLEATLAGREPLARYQSRASGTATVLTGALEASYDHVWETTVDGERIEIPVRGIAPLRRSGAAELACLTCDRRGSVAVSSAPADRFGLRALSSVGPTTAERLRTNGYETRAAVAEATEADLRAIDGIGASTARAIRHSARSLAESRVVRRTDEPVPPTAESATSLFVDIETDGLQPTIIWLIGVYDPQRDAYVDFVDTDPSRDDPSAATREFVSWLAAEYDAPSLVAWNGHAFDYKHLERFIARDVPEFYDYWRENVFTYDLYDWAVQREHAVLPGRTNRLEDVAEALGCDRSGPAAALDGKSLAERIRRLLESEQPSGAGSEDGAAATAASTGTAIDWAAAREYCEADVRELAAIAEAIATAPLETDRAGAETGGAEMETERERTTDDSTTQTGLADF